jgi:hypothetical protein
MTSDAEARKAVEGERQEQPQYENGVNSSI